MSIKFFPSELRVVEKRGPFKALEQDANHALDTHVVDRKGRKIANCDGEQVAQAVANALNGYFGFHVEDDDD